MLPQWRQLDVLGLEALGLTGDNKAEGVDAAARELEGASNLVVRNIESAAGDESDTALGVGGLVLVQEVELVALELVVADVSVAEVSL